MADQTNSERRIVIKDQRKNRPKDGINKTNNSHEISFKLNPNTTLTDLMKKLWEIVGNQDFVVTFMDRRPLDQKNFDEIVNGTHLWILNDFKQKLQEVVETPISFPPHHHTITESGMYEYYDSRGIDSLVISLAELIDNSLAATKANRGLRHIEIRYYDSGNDSMVLILDNGHGMTGTQLHDWARFKYSKFVRKSRGQIKDEDQETDTQNSGFSSADLPLGNDTIGPNIPDPKEREPGFRYLDSEINYFGAGGKQAVFNIGENVTMVSKNTANDIVELTLSKKKFEQKAQQDLDSVYKDCIISRSKGKSRNVPEDAPTSEVILDQVINEIEEQYKSFTICAIKGVYDKNQKQFRIKNVENQAYWPKGLARIYHYYLHGPKGKVLEPSERVMPEVLKGIDIVIQIFTVTKTTASLVETSRKDKIELKDITDDFETLLVQTAKDTFEFEVEHYYKPGVVIEGIIRYYPYLYDHESLPRIDPNEELGETASQRTKDTSELIDESELTAAKSFKRPREVFECFWHGRLIPQDCIDFEWNKYNSKNSNVKEFEECYNRLSGALFTNCAFHVSQNKQSFMDLSKLMAQKDCLTFYRITNNNSRHRSRNIFENEFINWLKTCHRKYDKQVLYKDFECEVSRNEFPSLKKTSYCNVDTYSVFRTIEWRDKEWKKDQIVLTQNTKPQGLIGRIHRFLVPKSGSNRENPNQLMGAPGLIELYQIPDEVYGKGSDASKIISFRKINADANEADISEKLDKIMDKLPDTVEIQFPVNPQAPRTAPRPPPITQGCEVVVGSPIPDMQVILKNSNGERLTTDRIPFKATTKKLGVSVKIFKVDVLNDSEVLSLTVDYPVAPFLKEWDYWILLNENGIKIPGKYRLIAKCVITSANTDNGRVETFPNDRPLPEAVPIEFTVVAGPPKFFLVAEKDLSTVLGTVKPFNLSLDFVDALDNITKPDPSIEKPVLSMEKFKISFKKYEIFENQLLIKNIIISGPLNQTTKTTIEIRLEPFKKQEVEITLLKMPSTKTPKPVQTVPKRSIGSTNGRNGPTPPKRPMVSRMASWLNANTSSNDVPPRRRVPPSHPILATPMATSSQISNSINLQSDANTTVATDNEEERAEPNGSTILEPDISPVRYQSSSSDSDSDDEFVDYSLQKPYHPLFDLLTLTKISFNDLELKPTQTNTNDPLIRHYETKIFHSFSTEWMVCAEITSQQSSIAQPMERLLSYKIVLKGKLQVNPMHINYVFLNASFRENKFYPDIHEIEFDEQSCTESPLKTIELMDANDCNKLLKQKAIRFRLIMFQI